MDMTQLIIRIDPKLKAAVDRLARAEGRTVSDVVRASLTEYTQNRDLPGYIDNLWDRIGTKLRKNGPPLRDVTTLIKQARAQARAKH